MEDCIFCRIVKGKLPSSKVLENEEFLAFDDVSPKAKIHILCIPKKHIISLQDKEGDDLGLMGRYMLFIRKTCQKAGIIEKGFKLVSNNGKAQGQLVNHVHFHVLSGLSKAPWQV